jgi:ubiquitin-protein ligase
MFKWESSIKGSEDTLYEGRIFFLTIEFPQDFPTKSPRIRFIK